VETTGNIDDDLGIMAILARRYLDRDDDAREKTPRMISENNRDDLRK